MKNFIDSSMIHVAAAIVAVGVLTAGCATEPDDLADDGIEEPVAPDDTVMPDGPDAPEPVCGTRYAEVEGDFPIPPNWTDGHPFTVGDRVGYADVMRFSLASGLMIRIFDGEGSGVQEHWLVQHDLRYLEEGSYVHYLIHDVKVREGLVYILWQASVSGPDGSPDPAPEYGLTVIMTSLNLSGTSHLPQLMWHEEHSFNHRLAFDTDGDLHLGSYNYLSGELSHRAFRETIGGYGFDGSQAEAVGQLDSIWIQTILNDFTAENGELNYLVGGPYRAMSVTHRYCD